MSKRAPLSSKRRGAGGEALSRTQPASMRRDNAAMRIKGNAPTASPSIPKFLRHTATASERWMWEQLRARRLHGFKFRRQEPLGPYVVDFYCHAARLVVELDG